METMSDGSNLVNETVQAQNALEGEPMATESDSMEQVAESMQEGIPAGPNWEGEAKKFQSMYDRASAENEKLRPIGQLLESRPDIVNTVQDMIVNPDSGKQSSDAIVDENEFNPWDAYYKPDSPSYKFRQAKEQETVSGAMQEVRGEFARREAEMQQRQFLDTTVDALKSKYAMNNNEIADFLDWSNQPKEAVGLGNLVKLFRDVSGNVSNTQSSIDAVKANQQSPQSAGVLQGQPPQERSDEDAVFDRVLNASLAGRLPLAKQG